MNATKRSAILPASRVGINGVGVGIETVVLDTEEEVEVEVGV